MTKLSPLRQRMTDDMTIRNLSPATQRSYIHAVAKFIRYCGRSPDQPGLDEVRDFQVHLVAKGVSWGALNQTVCALRFFYGVTLGEATIPERIPYARTPRKLPVILSADEVVRFLEAVSSLKCRAALTTAYAAGLRASEVAELMIADIDNARGVIRVRHGKGARDRDVMLSTQLLGILRTYWRLARPRHNLFPGRDENRPIVNGSFGITACLNRNVERVAVGIYCAPEPMFHAVDQNHNFIKMPLVIRPRPVTSDAAGKMRAKTIDQEPDCFPAYDHAALGKQILDIRRAKREPMLSPDRVGDNLTRVAKALQARHRRWYLHASASTQTRTAKQFSNAVLDSQHEKFHKPVMGNSVNFQMRFRGLEGLLRIHPRPHQGCFGKVLPH